MYNLDLKNIIIGTESERLSVTNLVEGTVFLESDTAKSYVRFGLNWFGFGGGMNWKGPWITGTQYYKQDTVKDGDWTMIALLDTIDRPAPQPSGNPTGAYGIGDPGWSTNAELVTLRSTATRFIFSEPGIVTEVRVWIPNVSPDYDYRVLIVDDTDSDAPIVILDGVINPTSTGWLTINVSPMIVQLNTNLIAILQAFNSAGAIVQTFNWDYVGRNNVGTPSAGDFNRNNGSSILRINILDDGGTNRDVELTAITPGTIITIGDDEWVVNVTSTSDNVSSWSFGVSTISGSLPNGADGVKAISWEEATPQSTDYVLLANYWVGNQPSWATATGLISDEPIVGSNGVVVEDNTGYGCDMTFDSAIISPDWQLVAFSQL